MSFRNKILISISIIALSVIIFGLLFYWLAGSIEKTAAEVAADRVFVSKQSQSVTLLADLKHMAPLVDAYQEKISKLMPTKDELINFPKWVEGSARAHNVSASTVFHGPAVPAGGAVAGFASFNLDAKGSYANLVDFYEEIESKSSRFILSVESFDVNLVESEYRVTSSGKVFYR